MVDWCIYLHEWLIRMVNVGKYTSLLGTGMINIAHVPSIVWNLTSSPYWTSQNFRLISPGGVYASYETFGSQSQFAEEWVHMTCQRILHGDVLYSEPLGLLKWCLHTLPSWNFFYTSWNSYWAATFSPSPTRKKQKKHSSSINTHFSLLLVFFHIFWACEFFKSKPPPIVDVTWPIWSELSSAHTVVRFRCPQHSWPNETRWGHGLVS